MTQPESAFTAYQQELGYHQPVSELRLHFILKEAKRTLPRVSSAIAATIHPVMAAAFFKLGKFEEALQHYRNASRLSPDVPNRLFLALGVFCTLGGSCFPLSFEPFLAFCTLPGRCPGFGLLAPPDAQLRAIKMATFCEEEPDLGSKGWVDGGDEFTCTDAAMALSGVIALLKHSPLLIEVIREFEQSTTAAGAERFERFHKNTEGGSS